MRKLIFLSIFFLIFTDLLYSQVQSLIVDPDPGTCVVSVSPKVIAFDKEGGERLAFVLKEQACTWNVSENYSWITITILNEDEFKVICAPNTTSSSRSATLSVENSTITVTQSAVPAPPPPPTVVNSCGYSTLSMSTPPAGVIYYWQGNSCGTSTANSQSSYKVYSDGTYYLRARYSDGTWSSSCSSVQVTIKKNPAVFSVTGGGKICSGSNTAIGLSGGEEAEYQLIYNGSDLGMPVYREAGGAFNFGNYSNTGTYQIRAIALNGCELMMNGSAVITYIAKPTVHIYQDEVNICKDNSAHKITATATGENISFQWQIKQDIFPYRDLTGETAPDMIVDLGEIMDNQAYYQCKVSNVCGTAISNEIRVDIRPLPAINISVSPSSNIDMGQSTTLTASGAQTYTWSPSAGLNTTSGASVVASPDESVQYTVEGTDNFGCKNTATQSVQINLSVQLTNNKGAISVQVSGGKPPYSYLWNNGATTPNITVTESGNYTLTVSDQFNQSKSQSIYVNDFGDFNQNYIKATTLTRAITTTDDINENNSLVDYQFFDGLGRLMQNVAVGQSPTGKDMIQMIEYDEFGREAVKYMPYTVDGNGGYRSPDKTQTEYKTFYQNLFPDEDTAFTAITVFESSPLNRIQEQGFAGKDWQPGEHTLKYTYSTNTGGSIPIYEVNDDAQGNTSITQNGYYDAGSLYLTITTDENDKQTKEYKNLQGKVILTEDAAGGQTRYIFDDYGLLRCTMPPKAQSPQDSLFCYYYKYDARKRMTHKKIPGAAWIYTVYNTRDLPVLTQDGNMRPRNQWMLTAYDYFNRPVLTGIYTHTDSLNQGQMAAAYNENFANSSNFQAYTKTHYDNYPDTILQKYPPPQNYNSKIKGQIAFTETYIPDAGKWLTTVNYYDDKYRVIKTYGQNHLGGTDIIENSYDFTGKIIDTHQTHTMPDTTYTLAKHFEYDHAGRLLETKMKFADDDTISLSKITYNELGQIKEKQIHKKTDNYLINNNFDYNIRGWTTQLQSQTAGNMLFDMQLLYNQNSLNPLFNGNISAMQWSSAKHTDARTYQFSYDNINRLTAAAYTGTTGENYSTAYSYDANGNMLSLSRNGQFTDQNYGAIDQLSYTYHGNQLIGVNDQSGNPLGFSDNGSTENVQEDDPLSHEYLYDANGNLTADYNKKINHIIYNHLNLPTLIDLGDNKIIEYLYDAAGIKLRQKTYNNGNLEKVTDYIGNFVYENSSLTYILTDEGRLVPDSIGFAYEYFIKDHLGNTRLVVKDSSGTAQIMSEAHYYPFGLKINTLAFASTEQKVANKYLYNGKELDEATGLYYYGARYYDAEIGRWITVDPLTEEYSNWSPYNYVRGNPIVRIDPNGMWDDGYTIDEHGNIKRVDNTGGNNYDVLYKKSAYDAGKRDYDESGTKSGVKVNDTKILPLLAKTENRFVQRDYWGHHTKTWKKNSETGKYGYVYNIEMLQGHASFSTSKSEAEKVFKFAATNSNVEWSLEGNKKGLWFIATLHSNGQAPNSELLTYSSLSNLETKNGSLILHSIKRYPTTVPIMGFDIPSLIYSAHSHPDGTTKDFAPSDGDIRAATQLRSKNSNIRIRLFMPKNPNTKWIDY